MFGSYTRISLLVFSLFYSNVLAGSLSDAILTNTIISSITLTISCIGLALFIFKMFKSKKISCCKPKFCQNFKPCELNCCCCCWEGMYVDGKDIQNQLATPVIRKTPEGSTLNPCPGSSTSYLELVGDQMKKEVALRAADSAIYDVVE